MCKIFFFFLLIYSIFSHSIRIRNYVIKNYSQNKKRVKTIVQQFFFLILNFFVSIIFDGRRMVFMENEHLFHSFFTETGFDFQFLLRIFLPLSALFFLYNSYISFVNIIFFIELINLTHLTHSSNSLNLKSLFYFFQFVKKKASLHNFIFGYILSKKEISKFWSLLDIYLIG